VREVGLPQRSRAGSLEAVLAVADALPRGRALDLPCGPGLASEALRRLGFQVTAADLDEKGFAAGPEIRFQRLDLDRPLPFADASFELVHCGDGIEHLENPMAALRELARVLAPGGSLLLTTPNYSSLERRLRFLLSGSLAKPLPRAGPGAREDERGHGHVSPLTLTQLCWMAERGGLALASARTLLPQPRQRLLAPLVLPALLYRALLSPERRRDLFAEQSGSLDVLLGGRKLLLVFGRRTEPRGGAAVSASLRAMQHVEVERRFAAPPAQVWKVYTDHAGWTSWAGLGRARLVAEGQPDRNGVGAVRCISTGGVSVFEEVLSFEPPKRMTYRVVRGGIPIMKDHLGEVLLEPDGAGTRLIWRCRFDSRIPGLGAPMRWLVTRLFRRALEGLDKRGFAT
jgi:SAM-dependent methyltransferase